MDSNLKYDMEDFLVQAQETLEKVNNSAKAVTNASNFLKWIIALTVLVFLGLYTDIKIGLGEKANANEVLFKRNALLIEKVRISNNERICAILVDTTLTMEMIKQYNQNYLWQVEGIYDLNFRGGE